MTGSLLIPSLDVLKQQAKSLRSERADSNNPVSHSQSLELVARQYGCRDWNTVHAASLKAAPTADFALFPGDRVTGHYLGQPFAARVLKLHPLDQAGLYRITMHFDEPVDVVTHDSFSAFRQRVSGTVDKTGRSPQKTSDGQPHIRLDLINTGKRAGK